MKKFELVVNRTCTIDERLRITLDAETEEEAMDVAYEVGSEFPSQTLHCERVAIANRTYQTIDDVDVIVLEQKDLLTVA